MVKDISRSTYPSLVNKPDK